MLTSLPRINPNRVLFTGSRQKPQQEIVFSGSTSEVTNNQAFPAYYKNLFTAETNVQQFRHASPQDKAILLSNTPEALSRKAKIQDDTGKTFYVIKADTNNADEHTYRLLDTSGKLLKTATVPDSERPKVILIDDFSDQKTMQFTKTGKESITHGTACLQYAQRANPFAAYDTINIADDSEIHWSDTFTGSDAPLLDTKPVWNNLYNRLISGEKIDCISISIGAEIDLPLLSAALDMPLNPNNLLEKKQAIKERLLEAGQLSEEELVQKFQHAGVFVPIEEELGFALMPEDKLTLAEIIKDQLQHMPEEIALIEKITSLPEGKTAVPPFNQEVTIKKPIIKISAGNNGPKSLNLYALADGVEIVGSTTKEGKKSAFSASRSLVHDYERGEYKTKRTEEGFNYTDSLGTDLFYAKQNAFYNGKPVSEWAITEEEFAKIEANKDTPLKMFLGINPRKLIHAADLAEVHHDPSFKEMLKKLGDYYVPLRGMTGLYEVDKQGLLRPRANETRSSVCGTSFSAPRSAGKDSLARFLKEIQLL